MTTGKPRIFAANDKIDRSAVHFAVYMPADWGAPTTAACGAGEYPERTHDHGKVTCAYCLVLLRD